MPGAEKYRTGILEDGNKKPEVLTLKTNKQGIETIIL